MNIIKLWTSVVHIQFGTVENDSLDGTQELIACDRRIARFKFWNL